MELLPHQQRVIDEKLDLDKKISNLKNFVKTTIFKNLHYQEQALLKCQLQFMKGYSKVLKRRIRLFHEQTEQ